MAADVNKGGIDRFIDLMVTRKDYATPERFELAYKLGKALAARASKVGGKELTAPELDLSKMNTITAVPQVRGFVGNKAILDGISDNMSGMGDSLVLSSDSLKGGVTGVKRCVLFINGDVKKSFAGLEDSVVFCNGDLGWITSVNRSVIVVTGTFEGATSANDSCFQAKSFGTYTRSRNNVYINTSQVTATSQEGNRLVQSDDGPLQMFKMFDTSYFGLEMGADDDELKVKTVREGTPFAKAGFEKDDILLRNDKRPIASAEEFRRFLRRQCAGDTATFKVQRGDKVVELKVEFTD
jgi:PDZ domain